jgi:aromatic-L-amino-acid decarboxylase
MTKNSEEFRKHAKQVIEWISKYYDNIENYPVKSQVRPGDIFAKIPETPPDEGEDFGELLADMDNIILPGITHWQSPKFFAYFPANSSIPSLLAEMITAAMGVQGMKWETSPAAAELEEKVLNWLRQETGLPQFFDGVIQDSASTATLVSILTAREKFSNYKINKEGMGSSYRFRIYCSGETHSSIERAVKVAGLGSDNLVKIPVDNEFRMNTGVLASAIQEDKEKGYQPLAIVATLGTTGSTSVDPLAQIVKIKKEHDLWLHVDAAYAGNALLLQEYRWMIMGIEEVDTFVFNPHKWLLTNFDCSAYFVKDKEALINTFQIVPEYLKTKSDKQVNNYSDWTIPLGRRFRALKLWFVLRYYGMNRIRDILREHIQLADKFKKWVQESPHFELLAPVTFNLVCFRYNPVNIEDDERLNEMNEKLLHLINDTGMIYMTHTKLDGKYTLRMVVGQTDVEAEHVKLAWELINETIEKL